MVSGADPYAVETERLLLRRFRPDDAAALHAIFSDPRVTATTNPGFAPSASQVRTFIERCAVQWEAHRFGQWGVVRRSSPTALIGYCGFRQWELDSSELELLFGFSPSSWGQGFATEAARAAVEFWRRELATAPLVASAFQDNARSHRVLEKAGLRRAERITTSYGEEVVFRLRSAESERATAPVNDDRS